MTLTRVTIEVDEVHVLMESDKAEYMEEVVGGTNEAVLSMEFVEEVSVHLKIKLKMKIPHYLKTKILVMEATVRTKFLTKDMRRTISSINNEKYNDDRLIFHIITGIKKIQQEPVLAGCMIHLPTIGSITQVSSVNRSITSYKKND